MGGKHRISKKISEFMESIRKPGQVFLEPFVGAANIITKMTGQRIGSDIDAELIQLLIAVRDGTVELPDNISKSQYLQYKNNYDTTPLRTFVGFACGFCGKKWGSYKVDIKRKVFNCAQLAKRGLLKKKPGLQNCELMARDYQKIEPSNMLIYCDPPYFRTDCSTTQLKNFDNQVYWDVMRRWSKDNIVVMSEYSMPADFKEVLAFPVSFGHGHLKTNIGRQEKLFMFNST
jgi:site-specific DNA-adenine methylase